MYVSFDAFCCVARSSCEREAEGRAYIICGPLFKVSCDICTYVLFDTFVVSQVCGNKVAEESITIVNRSLLQVSFDIPQETPLGIQRVSEPVR